jgi:hypothetical protein
MNKWSVVWIASLGLPSQAILVCLYSVYTIGERSVGPGINDFEMGHAPAQVHLAECQHVGVS